MTVGLAPGEYTAARYSGCVFGYPAVTSDWTNSKNFGKRMNHDTCKKKCIP